MKRLSVSEVTNKANLYTENKTFVFVRFFNSIGKYWNYNGYVTKVTTDHILFFDLKLGREIPIPIDFIEILEPSNKELNDEVEGGRKLL